MFFSENPEYLAWLFVLLGLWTIPWKALALWKSSRRGQIGWFIFFILINTLGIIEIIYLRKVKREEERSWGTIGMIKKKNNNPVNRKTGRYL